MQRVKKIKKNHTSYLHLKMPQLQNKQKSKLIINLDIHIRTNNLKIKKDINKDLCIKDILNNNQ